MLFPVNCTVPWYFWSPCWPISECKRVLPLILSESPPLLGGAIWNTGLLDCVWQRKGDFSVQSLRINPLLFTATQWPAYKNIQFNSFNLYNYLFQINGRDSVLKILIGTLKASLGRPDWAGDLRLLISVWVVEFRTYACNRNRWMQPSVHACLYLSDPPPRGRSHWFWLQHRCPIRLVKRRGKGYSI